MKFIYTQITSYDPKLGIVTHYPSLDAVLLKLGLSPKSKLDLIKAIQNKNKFEGLYFNAIYEQVE